VGSKHISRTNSLSSRKENIMHATEVKPLHEIPTPRNSPIDIYANDINFRWVAIAGAGGGLGHLATQIGSRGMAMRILGIDHGSKEELVKECGAEAFIDVTKYNDKTIAEEVMRITGGVGASAVIVCTASNKAYAQAMSFLRIGGTLVCVGMPEGDFEPIAQAFPATMVAKNHRIVGSAVGNQREAIEVLDMAARGVIKTKVRLEKMENLTEVFKAMSEGKLQGRVVLDLQ
jgi:propanol-preferring alcohol dehydrogenase